MRTFLAAVALGLVTTTATVAGKEVLLELGGPRQVHARIGVVENDYEVRVSMLAVQCFDDATNLDVNRSLARSFALQALARHLGKGPPVTMTVLGARLGRSGLAGKSFTLTLRVPRDGAKVSDRVRPLPSEDDREDSTERAVFDPSLLEGKGQYEQLIAQLEAALNAELKSLGRAARAADADSGSLERRSRALREKLQGNLDRLANEVRADRELLSIGSDLDPDGKSEKDQVLGVLTAARKRLLKRLESVREEVEK
jgi:hypothetical protein